MANKNPKRKAHGKVPPDGSPRQQQVQRHHLNEHTSLFLNGGIFLVHTLGLVCLFVPLAGLFDTEPVIEQDWGLHFHHLNSLATFLRQDRMVWGYNPFFMAGYPSNTIQDLSIKFFEFAALGLSTFVLTPIQCFKITAFLAMASVPSTI